MEVLLNFISNNIVYIIDFLVLISILGMIVSDIIRLSTEGEITHKKIIFRSNYFRQVLLTPVYAAIALFGVILIIYSLISYAEVKELTELCVGFIGGLILAIPFCYLIMSNIVSFVALCRKDFVILEDTLKDKAKSHFENNEFHLGIYKFYFEKLFTLYNLDLNVRYFTYKKALLEDKYYIVICHDEKMLLSKLKYHISKDLEDKIIPCDELDDYLEVEKVEEDSTKKKKEKLEPSVVLKEYMASGARANLIRNIIIMVLLLGSLMASIYTKKVILFIAVTFIIIAGLIATGISMFHTLMIVTKINNEKYEIKKDIIKKMNKRLRFKESNKWITLSLEHYKKDIYVNKKEFSSAKEKDEVFLVFVKGEYEPLVFEKKEYKLK